MAKFVPGPLADGIQGKIGGCVFRAGRAGRVVSGSPSVRRGPTEAQAFQRMLFADGSAAWAGLTNAQRSGWYTFAFGAAPPVNSFGGPNWGAARPEFLRWYTQAKSTGALPFPLFTGKPPYATAQYFAPLVRDGGALIAAVDVSMSVSGLAVWAADCGPATAGQVPARLFWKPIYRGAVNGPTVWYAGGVHPGLRWKDLSAYWTASPFGSLTNRLFLVRGLSMLNGVSIIAETVRNLYIP